MTIGTNQKKLISTLIKFLLKFGFTILLIYLVFSKIDIDKLKQVFKNLKVIYVIVAITAYIFSILITSWRLQGYLQNIKINIGFATNLKMYFLGLFYNVFLPGGVGGEGYKIYLLSKQYKQPAKKVFIAIFLDRFSGLWSIGLIITFLSCYIPQISIQPWLLSSFFLLGTAVYFIIAKRFFEEYSQHFIQSHFQAFIAQLFQMACVTSILLSQKTISGIAPYLLTFLISSLATIIPISIGGFGLREYVMMQGSTIFTMNTDIAIFVTLSFSLLSTLISLPGLWYIYHQKSLTETSSTF